MEQDRNAGRFRSQRSPQRTYGATSAYFVTIYTYQREPFLNIPVLEQILKQQLQELPQRFPEISLDQFVILSDQMHFIVWISAHTPSAPTLPQIIGAYKSLCAVA
jgi:REP element-mobilizing transposase RayT